MSTPGPHSTSDDEIDPVTALLSQPHNDAVRHYSDVLPPPIAAGDPHSRRHHVRSLDADIVIRQLPSEGLSFQLWPAATTFLSLLDSHRLNPSASPLLSSIPPAGRRIRILELGSGTGLVGIAAAAILGAYVTVTDLAHVIDNLKFNVTVNSKLIAAGGGEVNVAELSWGDVDQMVAIGREYDVILGSDVVYHDDLYEPLMETLRYFLVGGERFDEMVFVMAHRKRWKKEAAFFKKAKKHFDVNLIHRDTPSNGKRIGVVVYRFAGRKRQGSGSSGSGLGSGSASGASSNVGSLVWKGTGVGL